MITKRESRNVIVAMPVATRLNRGTGTNVTYDGTGRAPHNCRLLRPSYLTATPQQINDSIDDLAPGTHVITEDWGRT